MIACAVMAMAPVGPSLAAGEDCARAEALFRSSYAAPDERRRLEQAVGLCPDHAGALNNLGLLEETQGNLAAAEELYRKSIVAGGGAAPYAGLGDILAARGDSEGAQQAYRRFLDLLDEEKAAGDPGSLAIHEAAYREKLRLAGGGGPTVAAADVITRGLTQSPLSRGMSVVHHEEPHIDLPILFALGSDRLAAAAEAQLLEVARALQSPALAPVRILVEGHTDAIGGEDYNLALSERRALTVSRRLQDLGVDGGRLSIAGRGEARPVASNETPFGRSRNRRVTFVNLDRGS
ncbi:MAG: OmpA family protein [Rhodospirillales bacterium]